MPTSRQTRAAARQAEAPQKRRCSPSWARLIAKVYHAGPLTCRDCGGPLAIVAYLHDRTAIRQMRPQRGASRQPAQDRASLLATQGANGVEGRGTRRGSCTTSPIGRGRDDAGRSPKETRAV